MVEYRAIQDFERTEWRAGKRITVVVAVRGDGPPLIKSIRWDGAGPLEYPDDAKTPSYEPTGDTARDIELAMEAAFDWAERELP